jgi:hypothetical protein
MTRVLSLRAPSAPLLSTAAAEQILRLDATTRAALRSVLLDLRTSSRWDGDGAWRTRKGPMATYRHEIARHASLLARALRQPGDMNTARSLPHRAAGHAAEHDQRKPRSSRASSEIRSCAWIASCWSSCSRPIRGKLRALLHEFARACAGLAEQCWDRQNRNLALYWRTVSTRAASGARFSTPPRRSAKSSGSSSVRDTQLDSTAAAPRVRGRRARAGVREGAGGRDRPSPPGASAC